MVVPMDETSGRLPKEIQLRESSLPERATLILPAVNAITTTVAATALLCPTAMAEVTVVSGSASPPGVERESTVR